MTNVVCGAVVLRTGGVKIEDVVVTRLVLEVEDTVELAVLIILEIDGKERSGMRPGVLVVVGVVVVVLEEVVDVETVAGVVMGAVVGVVATD